MNTKKMIFISRHQPTQRQEFLALCAGYWLNSVGDVNAFDDTAVEMLLRAHPDAAVCCVHPLIAMIAAGRGRNIGVFENSNRAPEGEKPTFEASSLVICKWGVLGNAEVAYEGVKRYDLASYTWEVVRTDHDGSKRVVWVGDDPADYNGGLGCFPTNDHPELEEEYGVRELNPIKR